MNPEQEELFQSIILDHDNAPRNFFEMDDATHAESGHNPVCGDRFKIYLDIDGQQIRRASFQGRGCAISKASASMMAAMLPGKTVREAEDMRAALQDLLMSESPPDESALGSVAGDVLGDSLGNALGELEALTGVRDHPSRVSCVMLAWDAMEKAIDRHAQGLDSD